MSAPATDARAERAARCRLCGGELRFEFVASDRNRGLGREHFRYFRCRSCRCVLQPEVPASLARHYAPQAPPRAWRPSWCDGRRPSSI